MEQKATFRYFYGEEADMHSFYRIPKLLFTFATAFDCFMHSQSLSYTFQESYSGYSRVWQS